MKATPVKKDCFDRIRVSSTVPPLDVDLTTTYNPNEYRSGKASIKFDKMWYVTKENATDNENT